MSEPRDLQAARERVAAEIDGLVNRFQVALARVWRRLDRQMVVLVNDAAADSPTAIIKAARAGRLKQEIEAALDEAGWTDLVDHSTGAALTPLVADVNTVRLAAEIAEFTTIDGPRLEALKVLAGTDLLEEGQAVAHALWQATVQGVFSSRDVRQILDDLGEAIDASAPQVRTLYDTSISIFARQAESLGVPAAKDSPFVYTGPSDEKVRPFCRQHLGKVYTREAIDGMTNGQLPNVFLTGGGYNCRHGWTAVSKFGDLAPLANTGARVDAFSRGLAAGDSKAA